MIRGADVCRAKDPPVRRRWLLGFLLFWLFSGFAEPAWKVEPGLAEDCCFFCSKLLTDRLSQIDFSFIVASRSLC
jgi:hypothetical protein